MRLVDTPEPLPSDHPGFHDPAYRQRRSEIARAADAWNPGDPIPLVDYTPAEDEVWATVSSRLADLHRRAACRAYLDGAEALVLPADRVPQLREVDRRVVALTGFGVHPVPGLVPTRRFYGSLADRVFLSTQYVRHHSVPFYTPEPDIVHEIVGHANMLASRRFADLYVAAGRASRRAATDDALDVFSRVFWFTLEFGVVHEGDELRAYGAGLLSSYGELAAFATADIRPWDVTAMATTSYDITTYQPVLFAADSFERMLDDLTEFFEGFDDDSAASLVRETT